MAEVIDGAGEGRGCGGAKACHQHSGAAVAVGVKPVTRAECSAAVLATFPPPLKDSTMGALILGLLLFLGMHSVRIFAKGWRSQVIAQRGGGAWKGLYALVSLVGFGLIVWGYGQARPMNSRPSVGLVRSLWEVLNQHRAPVLTMEGWGMFRRRAAGEPVAKPSS